MFGLEGCQISGCGAKIRLVLQVEHLLSPFFFFLVCFLEMSSFDIIQDVIAVYYYCKCRSTFQTAIVQNLVSMMCENVSCVLHYNLLLPLCIKSTQ